MPRFDIPWEDHYIGIWVGPPSRELHIRKVGPSRYLATLLIHGEPIQRPWMNDALTIDMPASYSFSALEGSDFSVDLWTKKRFALSLNYEPDYQMRDGPSCEALTMGIARDEELDFLEQYHDLLGGLEHFMRLRCKED